MKNINKMKVGDLIKLTPLCAMGATRAIRWKRGTKTLRIHLQQGELLFGWDPETEETICLMPSCPDAKTTDDVRWDSAQVWDVDGETEKRIVFNLYNKRHQKIGDFWMFEKLGHISQSVAEKIAHPTGTTLVILSS